MEIESTIYLHDMLENIKNNTILSNSLKVLDIDTKLHSYILV